MLFRSVASPPRIWRSDLFTSSTILTLAAQARIVLDVNKSERHIRGGLATREKYQHRLAICNKQEE